MATVYLLGNGADDGTFKIGVTRGNIEKRIKKLQTGNAEAIYVVMSYETDIPFLIEKNLHQRFNDKRMEGEWFKLDSDDIVHFKEICKEIEGMFASLQDSNNPYVTKMLKKATKNCKTPR